jgi:hypothetical protein
LKFQISFKKSSKCHELPLEQLAKFIVQTASFFLKELETASLFAFSDLALTSTEHGTALSGSEREEVHGQQAMAFHVIDALLASLLTPSILNYPAF